jgi:hypothetical protein
MAVPYLDSRAIQNRLDEVIGRENWQNTLTPYALGANSAFICTISIYHAERKEWISKSNGAGSTKIEPVKGGLSDALKRAASMWGIGRYLYEFSGVWVDLDQYKNITKGDYKRLEEIYTDTVKRLFPRPTAAPTVPNTPTPVQNQATPTIKEVQIRGNVSPIYKVISARMNKGHSVLELMDSTGEVLTAYFNGEAKLAQNQQITDVNLQKKQSGGVEFYALEAFRLAPNQVAHGYQENQGSNVNHNYADAA